MQCCHLIRKLGHSSEHSHDRRRITIFPPWDSILQTWSDPATDVSPTSADENPGFPQENLILFQSQWSWLDRLHGVQHFYNCFRSQHSRVLHDSLFPQPTCYGSSLWSYENSVTHARCLRRFNSPLTLDFRPIWQWVVGRYHCSTASQFYRKALRRYWNTNDAKSMPLEVTKNRYSSRIMVLYPIFRNFACYRYFLSRTIFSGTKLIAHIYRDWAAKTTQ